MFNIVPHVGRVAAFLPAPHGPRNTSAPGQVQAGVAAARRLELPKSAPSLATAAAPPVTRRDAAAEGLRGAEVPAFSARGARCTPGLVVLLERGARACAKGEVLAALQQ